MQNMHATYVWICALRMHVRMLTLTGGFFLTGFFTGSSGVAAADATGFLGALVLAVAAAFFGLLAFGTTVLISTFSLNSSIYTTSNQQDITLSTRNISTFKSRYYYIILTLVIFVLSIPSM